MVYETFQNPPIVEALLDIQVDHVNVVGVSDLKKLHEKIKEKYPEIKPIRTFRGTFQHIEGHHPTATAEELGVQGYQFWTADKKQVVQFRLDGFSFSRLPPYKHWEQIEEEANHLWELYADLSRPILIKRQAVRYINSIKIPSQKFLLEDYFSGHPQLPKGLPNDIEQFFSRITVSIAELNAKAIISISSATPTPSGTSTIILDIDVFILASLIYNSKQMWDRFLKLRIWKNEIFHKSITEKTKELFR